MSVHLSVRTTGSSQTLSVGDTGLHPSAVPITCIPWGCALLAVPQPLSAAGGTVSVREPCLCGLLRVHVCRGTVCVRQYSVWCVCEWTVSVNGLGRAVCLSVGVSVRLDRAV